MSGSWGEGEHGDREVVVVVATALLGHTVTRVR